MKVSHVNDHITHAIIGGNQAIDFGISQSAEFFHILSSTLYTNQKLAVVRETLCNAWDAHIEAGITDRAIEVTLNNGKFIIRDFGKGIPKDKIGPVYGMYGGSTKLLNGQVTGGFGLGCKAPFAYTDHFEVISFCDGIKTIYNMSKSSAEVEGKPSIMPIISIPTEETGLQVTIDLKEGNYDRNAFSDLIHLIVQNGGMKVELNGAELPCIDFSNMVHGFILTKKNITAESTNQSIFIRYGNVIYPIEDNSNYTVNYQYIQEILKRLGDQYYSSNKYRIIFQAKPDTISVTPSRESLSMQTKTVDTLSEILKKFVNECKDKLYRETLIKNEESIKKIWLNDNPGTLTGFNLASPSLPRLFSKESTHSNHDIFNFQQIAEYSALRKYPTYYINYVNKDMEQRLNALMESGYSSRGLVQSFRNEIRGKASGWGTPTNWFHKRIAVPLTMAMAQHKLKADKLFVYGDIERRRWGDPGREFCKALELPKRAHYKYMGFLRNFVIIAHSRIAVEDRASKFPAIKHYFGGSAMKSLVYMVPRNPDRVDEALSFFKMKGYYIIDLTKVHSWEDKHVAQRTIAPQEYTPKKTGIPCLSAAFPDGATIINSMLLWKDDTPRIEDPEFVIKFAAKSENKTLVESFKEGTMRYIIKTWGSKGGIVVNSNQQAKYEAKGALPFLEYFWNKIVDEYQHNPRIIGALPFMAHRHFRMEDRWDNSGQKAKICLKIIKADPDLKDYFGIVDDLTSDDKFIMLIKEDLLNTYNKGLNNQKGTLEDYIKTIPMDPVLDKIYEMTQTSTLLKTLNLSEVLATLSIPDDGKNPSIIKQKERIRDIFLEVLEG